MKRGDVEQAWTQVIQNATGKALDAQVSVSLSLSPLSRTPFFFLRRRCAGRRHVLRQRSYRHLLTLQFFLFSPPVRSCPAPRPPARRRRLRARRCVRWAPSLSMQGPLPYRAGANVSIVSTPQNVGITQPQMFACAAAAHEASNHVCALTLTPPPSTLHPHL